jgi:hypothetical protein
MTVTRFEDGSETTDKIRLAGPRVRTVGVALAFISHLRRPDSDTSTLNILRVSVCGFCSILHSLTKSEIVEQYVQFWTAATVLKQ